MTWNGETVEAWCGTAYLESWGDYEVLGCYPFDDCWAEEGFLENLDGTISDTLTYEIACGATKLFAAASAAIAVAASL